MQHKEILGKKFGKLTIKEIFKDSKTRHYMCICICDCGKKTIVRKSNILAGKTKSCGGKVSTSKFSYKNQPRLYRIRRCMIRICVDSSYHGYSHYGAHGISVCEEWLDSFSSFCE